MYNNTSNNGENVASSILSSGLKKQQKGPKPRKRGPGVAELEKMRRDQEVMDMTDKKSSKGINGNHYESESFLTRDLSNEFNPILPYPGINQEGNNQHSPSMMAGTKRSQSSTLKNSLISPSNFHVLPSFSHYNRSHESFINSCHGLGNFDSTKEWDAKWGRTLELNSDIAVPGHKDFPSPEVPSPRMHLFPGVLSKGNVLPYQVPEDKMDSCQNSESSGADHKPFYNFLGLKDSEGMINGAKHEGNEAERIDIDLNLKL
ncbi:hypothetical protein Fmac_030701 [Flemingia macrophylla]|uniref:Uncharacterized protein n=1 Tax=Flemingia macrophylla TaxID=520843 RepID=A0ABD1KZY1_9FABA